MTTSPREAGAGCLEIERVRGRSVVTRAFARAPLKLLTPKNHGDAAWVFGSTLGGGLVDGDHVRLDVKVGPGARGVLGTQASTKVYRSPVTGSRQDLTVKVDDGALFVAAPDHVTCFAGARYEQRIAIDLAASASLVFCDALSAGRVARGERWAFDRFASRTTITQAGKPLLHDAVVLDPKHGDLATRFGRFDALATLVMVGAELRGQLADGPTGPPPRRAALVEARSPLGDGVIVRLAAESTELLIQRCRGLLGGLGDLLGDDLFARRW